MFSDKRLIVLLDFETVQDADTGNRTVYVQNAIQVIGEKTFVGVTSQTLAQMQNMTFNFSITIDKMFYNDQKYLFVDCKLYKIQNVALAKLPKDCKLNVVEFKDDNLEDAVKRWLNDL